MIKIKTERFIGSGEKRIRILKIDMLTRDELPTEYIQSGKRCYYTEICLGDDLERTSEVIRINDSPYESTWLIASGSRDYGEAEFNEKLDYIKICGERLKEINKRQAIENADWAGIVTVCV